MSKSILIIDTPKTCGDCPLCIFSADEKRSIGFCHTSDEDYYCKVLDRFMEYDRVDGGLDILGKPTDCPLKAGSEEQITVVEYGGTEHHINCKSFEFRTNQVENWIRIKYKDGSIEEIHDVCVIKTESEG